MKKSYFINKFQTFFSKEVFLDLNEYNISNNIKNKITNYFIEYIIADFGNLFASNSICKNNYLENVKVEILKRKKLFLDFIDELFYRVDTDFALLNRFFYTNKALKITNIKLLNSDLHCKNKVTALITFNRKFKTIYKPFDISPLEFIQNLNNVFFNNAICFPKYINRFGYGWVEFITKSDIVNDKDYYSYNCGFLLGFCKMLLFTDLHCENIIFNNDFPVIIDFDAFGYKTIECAILNTLLIAKFKIKTNDSLVIKSGFYNTNLFKKYEIKNIFAKYNNKIVIKRKGKVKNVFKNQVYSGKLIYNPLSNDNFISGYSDFASILLKNKLKIIKYIDDYNDFKVRLIPKPTFKYEIYKAMLHHPEIYYNKEDEKKKYIFDRFDTFKVFDDLMCVNKFKQSEYKQLCIGDIPYFNISFNNGYICDGFGFNQGCKIKIKKNILSNIKQFTPIQLRLDIGIIKTIQDNNERVNEIYSKTDH